MAASARISCPLASSYLAVFVEDLMAADKEARDLSDVQAVTPAR